MVAVLATIVLTFVMAKRYDYYDIKNPPLLLQGFGLQSVVAGVTNESREQFILEVNRGVVWAIDYDSLNLAILLGQDESFWNDARISADAGGQDLIKNVPAERFEYNIDLGTKEEQKIQTWLNGGQTVNSILQIDPASLSPIPNIQVQLHAYYITEELKAWRAGFEWKSGVGLKRRGYSVSYDAAASGTFTVEDILPKNQGNIIGFSILHLGLSLSSSFIDLSVDGIQIIKNVGGTRFSRFNQRDPFAFKIPLMPGSTFRMDVTNANLINQPGTVYITFYFDN